jgi:hypothetical protein
MPERHRGDTGNMISTSRGSGLLLGGSVDEPPRDESMTVDTSESPSGWAGYRRLEPRDRTRTGSQCVRRGDRDLGSWIETVAGALAVQTGHARRHRVAAPGPPFQGAHSSRGSFERQVVHHGTLGPARKSTTKVLWYGQNESAIRDDPVCGTTCDAMNMADTPARWRSALAFRKAPDVGKPDCRECRSGRLGAA